MLRERAAGPARAAFVAETARVPDALEALSNEYDRLRREVAGGSARTARMTAIVEDMKLQAPAARGALPELKASRSAGPRLAAIPILQPFPRAQGPGWPAGPPAPH